ncbi:MAG: outer membrane protein assembly factor BamD [Sphingomonadaceae bacterium]
MAEQLLAQIGGVNPKATRESLETFKELSLRFPDSKYTPDARLRMRYLVNTLASYQVHVARYYVKRGAYVAAANRAQAEVKDFPDSPATEEALLLLVKSYDALGLTDLRDDADRVMRKNFPNSRFLVTQSPNGQPWWKVW